MAIKRIPLLFHDSGTAPERIRLITALTAVYKAVSDRQQDGNQHLELTDESNGVSIDEVMKQLNYGFGTPDRPGYKPVLSIRDTIRTIRQLQHRGYLNDNDGSFEIITLTDQLFSELGHQVAGRIEEREVINA